MNEEQPEPYREFAFVEYHEAANAYFNGVDIGYTTVKHYVTINALFAALLGALAEPRDGALAAAGDMMKWVPWIAIAISLALVAALPHYFRHLENCRKRCQEIEHRYGGKLFTSLGKITHRKAAFNTGLGLMVIIGLVIAGWILFGVKIHSPGLTM